MPHYRIENGVPPQKPSVASKHREILNKLEVGQSFTIPAKEGDSLSTATGEFHVKDPQGKRFSRKKIDKVTIRVWRIR